MCNVWKCAEFVEYDMEYYLFKGEEIMDLEESLKQLGLNIYEVKAYIAILKNSQLSGPKVSKVSRVPFSRVYDVLSSLEEKGLVESKMQRPKIYRAIKPGIAIDNLLKDIEKRQQKELQFKSNIASKIIPALEEFYKEKLEVDETIWTIHGNENVIRKIDEIISKTKKILRIAGKKPFYMLNCREMVERAALKKVEIKAIGEFNPECIDMLERVGAKYKTFKFIYQYFLISDEKIALIVILDQNGIPTGVFSENSDFVKANLELFERMWQDIG